MNLHHMYRNLNPIKSPRKRTSPKKPIKLSLDIPHSAPQRWEETYNLIKTQRANLIAPVDTMGCDQAGRDPSDGECKVSEAERRLSCLVSLMLSSQTKDQITHEALMNLRSKLSNGLSIQSLRTASLHQIEECIKKVGFWRRKSVYLKQMAEDLFRFHQSDVPNTLEGLVALKGVGPKMAFLALASAWSINEGIGVDTHVHRITNRLGWHSIPTIDPEKTRLNLQSWLPKPLHQEINHLLVGFGQMICLPIGPKCEICLVGTREGLCPSKKLIKDKKRKSKIKKVKEVEEESEEEGVEIETEAKVKVEVEVNESRKGMKDVKGKVKFEDEDEDRKVRLSSLGINQEEVHQEEHLISLIKKEDLIDDW
ncbi:DNA glycosylase [Melampsora americana]|nr:DNA glycosylase [Melampsora americana]